MPTIPQQETIVQYITNVSQTNYTFAFYAPLTTDIQVYYQASNAQPIPASDLLVLNVDYTVTYNSDPTTGGTITLLFTPTTGYYLTINRQVAPTLTTNFAAAQTFNGANLDAALDRLLLLIQQNFNYINQRNLSYVINTYLPNATPFTQLPPLAQNQFWIGSGSGVVAATVSQVPSASVLQSMLANNAPGTDGALLVGYYDVTHSSPTTVDAYLKSLSNQTFNTLVDTGSVNAYLATLIPAITTYTINTNVNLVISNTNTINSPTLNINGVGAGFINLPDGLPILPGDLQQGMIANLRYDTVTGGFQLLNPAVGRRKPSVASSAYVSAAQNFTGLSAIKVAFNTAAYDPLSLFTSASNRFVANYAGYYRISAVLAFYITGGSGANCAIMYLFKNGTVIKTLSSQNTALNFGILSGETTVKANANDYFEIWILKTDSANGQYANNNIGQSGQAASDFVFEYLGT